MNLATVVSLLMFVGAVRVTKWTHHAAKPVYSRATNLEFRPERGWVVIVSDPAQFPPFRLPSRQPSAVPGLWWWRGLSPEGAITWVGVHCAWLVSLSLLVPVLRLLPALHKREPRAGECPRCFYDLRGNLSGVCPECGTPAGSAAASA